MSKLAAADVTVASSPPPPSVFPSSAESDSTSASSSVKLLSLLKAKKEKEREELTSPTQSSSLSTASPPSSSSPQPSSSAASPISASSSSSSSLSTSSAAASSDALAKLAFWKKKSGSGPTTPKGFRSASFNNLTTAERLQNTSSMALAAATGRGSKGSAGGGGDRQQQEDEQEGREPTSATSPTKGAKKVPAPVSPPAVSLSASPPASTPSLLNPHPARLSPSLNGSVTDANNSPNSPAVPGSAPPAASPFSLSSSAASDTATAAAPAAASNPSSSHAPTSTAAKTSSSYYSNSSYYSSLGGSTSLAAFRQSITMAKSPSFSSSAAAASDTAAVSVTAPSSPRHSTDDSKAAAVADVSSSLSTSPGTSLSTSPVTSPITSPRRMPRASSLDTTLQSLSNALHSASLTSKDAHSSNVNKKASNLLRLLQDDTLSLEALRRLAWSGVPMELRSVAWKLLMEYVPVQRKRRDAVLENRRNEYHSYLDDYDRACSENNKSEDELAMLRQIRADIPRTTPGIGFFKRADVAQSLERTLYVFALRHPASGYVQGMNDLITPFYTVFVYDWQVVDITNNALTGPDVLELEEDKLLSLEADCYWCLSKLLDGIQDNYTFAQPGIQRAIFRMREIVERVDAALIKHLDAHNVQLLHFAFRWMNCLLMRELHTPLIVRLWDSYLADDAQSGFKTFHLYVCVALLVTFSKDIKQLEGGELIVFLQRLPTDGWREKDIDTLIAQAFLYRSWFDDAPRHLK